MAKSSITQDQKDKLYDAIISYASAKVREAIAEANRDPGESFCGYDTGREAMELREAINALGT